jgi:hypothetical protein
MVGGWRHGFSTSARAWSSGMTTPTKLHRRKDGTIVEISSSLWHQLNSPNSKRGKKIAADMAKYEAAMAEKHARDGEVTP